MLNISVHDDVIRQLATVTQFLKDQEFPPADRERILKGLLPLRQDEWLAYFADQGIEADFTF